MTGTVTGVIAGESTGARNPYSIDFSGVFTGSFDAENLKFEGSVLWSGEVTPGVESALYDDDTWDGAILGAGYDCANGIPGPCLFGATRPDVEIIWQFALDDETIGRE